MNAATGFVAGRPFRKIHGHTLFGGATKPRTMALASGLTCNGIALMFTFLMPVPDDTKLIDQPWFPRIWFGSNMRFPSNYTSTRAMQVLHHVGPAMLTPTRSPKGMTVYEPMPDKAELCN